VRHVAKPLNEDDFVASIAKLVRSPAARIRVGIGDDAAVWKPQRAHLSLITTDALTDDVHFRLSATTARALGHKALAVNLSDIAAMGGSPVLATVALGITEAVDQDWALEFYAGMSALARPHRCAIVGGDIFRAERLTISVTVVGEVRRSGLKLRSGARAGDLACVTGPLGLAAGGLRVMEGRAPLEDEDAATLLRAYEEPSPRIAEGRMLGAAQSVHALMDISDGLSLDLARMAQASHVTAVLHLDALPVPAALRAFSDARDLVLGGGDDYELLAAVAPRSYPFVAKRFRARFQRSLQVVGHFERGPGQLYGEEDGRRVELAPRGWDHFSRSTSPS